MNTTTSSPSMHADTTVERRSAETLSAAQSGRQSQKLTTLNFLVNELRLDHVAWLGGQEAGLAARFHIGHHLHHNTRIGLLCLDEDALDKIGSTDVGEQLLGLVARNGVVCIDAAHASHRAQSELLPEGQFEVVFSQPDFCLFARVENERPLRSIGYQLDLHHRKQRYQRQLERQRQLAASAIPTVAVVVLCFQHARFITECLASIVSQRGHFRMKVIVIDDASTDDSLERIRAFTESKAAESAHIEVVAHPENVGMVSSLAEAMRRAAGHDHVTLCDGDDFWSSDSRVQVHLDCLQAHPDATMSFNSIEICAEDGSSRAIFDLHTRITEDRLDGEQVARQNVPGNISACFYRGAFVDVLPQDIFDLYAGDWMITLYASLFGPIAHVKDALSVYRQHPGGTWSALPAEEKATSLLACIASYNAYLDYQYDHGLQWYAQQIYVAQGQQLAHADAGSRPLDLIVFDDVFPSTRSGFRYAEFSYYLQAFPRALVLSSGAALSVLEETPFDDVLRSYKRRKPPLGARVMKHSPGFPLKLAKLVYVNFLSNAHALLPEIESAGVPFVFTLYPGAGFARDDAQSDKKLRRLFRSPCFRKVIVTQPITQDYLLSKALCAAESIEMIFGVVMPARTAPASVATKCRWGFGKPRMDVCFMAHKYTAHGEDKGYDVFVNVAGLLRQRHDNIHFHVVGPFDASVMHLGPARDRITFHGSLDPVDFDRFFEDMDLILSPNISGKIFPGAFDGFPTASCTEAGLRGVAIFATDEFGAAPGRFADGEDIVLIRYDLADIVSKIEHYHARPGKLRDLGERTMQTIERMYSLDAQMMPRVALLQGLIDCPSRHVQRAVRPAWHATWGSWIPHHVRLRLAGALQLVKRHALAWRVRLSRPRGNGHARR